MIRMDKTLRKILNHNERVTFTVTHGKTKQEVKVVLEGNGICCKNIRDNIVVWGPNGSWVQGDLYREMLEEEGE
jgi:hypothetical protein